MTRVRRVPKQNTSTRRPAAMAANANCINAREYGAIEPEMSRISTSGRVRRPRSRHARWNGSPCVRSDRRSVRRTSNRAPTRAGAVAARVLHRQLDRELADQVRHAQALLLREVAERLLAKHLGGARDDPDRCLPLGERVLLELVPLARDHAIVELVALERAFVLAQCRRRPAASRASGARAAGRSRTTRRTPRRTPRRPPGARSATTGRPSTGRRVRAARARRPRGRT